LGAHPCVCTAEWGDQRIAERRGNKIARVAAARKLLTLVFYGMRDQLRPSGLHFADIQRLLEMLGRLVEAGNSVVVIEHNLDVIKAADYIIDMGPQGGDRGGRVIAIGTPEEVAEVNGSLTGEYLRPLLAAVHASRNGASNGHVNGNGYTRPARLRKVAEERGVPAGAMRSS